MKILSTRIGQFETESGKKVYKEMILVEGIGWIVKGGQKHRQLKLKEKMLKKMRKRR